MIKKKDKAPLPEIYTELETFGREVNKKEENIQSVKIFSGFFLCGLRRLTALLLSHKHTI